MSAKGFCIVSVPDIIHPAIIVSYESICKIVYNVQIDCILPVWIFCKSKADRNKIVLDDIYLTMGDSMPEVPLSIYAFGP